MISFKKIQIFLLLLLFTSCGYKISNLNNDFKITEVNTSGDKRVNFKLKTIILNSSRNDNQNLFEIALDTNKTKDIAEKNNKNQITKYRINIATNVKYTSLDKNITGSFKINKSSTYQVLSQYSETLSSEKKTTDNLIISLAEEINFKLSQELNDF